MSTWALFVMFLQAALLSSSGWGSVALVRASVVERHALVSDDQLVTFLSLSQITPGPVGFYFLFVGYAARGVAGAALAWLALVLPSFLVIPIQGLISRGADLPGLQGAVNGIVAGSGALMLATAIQLTPEALDRPVLLAVAVSSFVGLTAGSLPSFVVVVCAAIAGALLRATGLM